MVEHSFLQRLKDAIEKGDLVQVTSTAKHHADAITAWLRDMPPPDLTTTWLERRFADPDSSQIVEAFYLGLAEGLSKGHIEPEHDAAIEEAFNADLVGIGVAFRDGLCGRSPLIVRTLVDMLRPLPVKADAEVARMTAEEADVQAGRPLTDPIIEFGVTPLMVFQSADTTSMDVQRAQQRGVLSREPVLLAKTGVLTGGEVRIPRETLISHISAVTHGPELLCGVLFDWGLRQATRLPHYYPGFVATPQPTGIRLEAFDDRPSDVFVCWGAVRPMPQMKAQPVPVGKKLNSPRPLSHA
jgi:hypothetical protein